MSKSKLPKGSKKSKKKAKLSLVKRLKTYEKIFEKAKKNTKASPNIDLKKVNRIRDAIKKGKYEVDYSKLVDKILDDF